MISKRKRCPLTAENTVCAHVWGVYAWVCVCPPTGPEYQCPQCVCLRRFIIHIQSIIKTTFIILSYILLTVWVNLWISTRKFVTGLLTVKRNAWVMHVDSQRHIYQPPTPRHTTFPPSSWCSFKCVEIIGRRRLHVSESFYQALFLSLLRFNWFKTSLK